MGINGSGGLAGNHGAHHVADRQGFRALAFGFALGRERIGGLSGLRNHYRQHVLRDNWIAVAELAAIIYFHRNSRQFFDQEFAHQRRMPAGAAGHNLHFAERAELGRRDVHLVEENATRILTHAAQHGVPHGARLLKNFLEHEVFVATLFGHDRVPQHMLYLTLHGVTVEIGQLHAVPGENGHVAVSQEEHIPRVTQNRRYIGSDEVFVCAQPDHHRGAFPRRHNLMRIATAEYRKCKHAAQLLYRHPHGFFQVAGEGFFD